MNIEPAGPNAIIFDTEGIDELFDNTEAGRDERRLDEQAQEMIRSWDKDLLDREAEKIKSQYTRGEFESTYYEGDKGFDEMKENMEEVVPDTLWMKKEKSNPVGKEILASSTVQFDRCGYLEYEPVPYETTLEDGRPAITNMNDAIMPGIVQALLFLREGESAFFLLHPKMMYGALGAPPNIPPHAYLLYYFRIHKVWDGSDLEIIRDQSKDQFFEVPLTDKMELAAQHKDRANKYLADDNPREALVRYKAALKWILESPEEEWSQSKECKKLLETLWQNIAITLNKIEKYKSASKAAHQALNLNPENVKAIYQLAKARMSLGDHERALKILNHGKDVAPKSPDLRHLRAKLDINMREEKIKRDEILLKMSKASFN